MPTIREIAGLPEAPAKLSESALVMIDCQNTYREGVMKLEGVEEAKNGSPPTGPESPALDSNSAESVGGN